MHDVSVWVDPYDVLDQIDDKELYQYAKGRGLDFDQLINVSEIKSLVDSYRADRERFEKQFARFVSKHTGMIL